MTNQATELRNNMIQNAKCYNKYLTDEYFENKTLAQIICFTHPIDRSRFNSKHYTLFGHYINAHTNVEVEL